jgi:hypothetical protein
MELDPYPKNSKSHIRPETIVLLRTSKSQSSIPTAHPLFLLRTIIARTINNIRYDAQPASINLNVSKESNRVSIDSASRLSQECHRFKNSKHQSVHIMYYAVSSHQQIAARGPEETFPRFQHMSSPTQTV